MRQTGQHVRAFARHTMGEKSVCRRNARNNPSKLKERSGNVFENKGPLWKTAVKTGIL
jgi:hypothetical protein